MAESLSSLGLQTMQDAMDSVIVQISENMAVSLEEAKEIAEKNGYCERVPLDNLTLNTCVFGGGVPLRRIFEIYGKEANGKSTLCYYIIQQFQKAGLTCAMIETENKFNFAYLRSWGVDTNKLIIPKIEEEEGGFVFEDAMEKSFDCLKAGANLIVFDSVVGCPTKKDVANPLEAANMGGRSKTLTTAVSRFSHELMRRQNNASVILVNQARDNISAYGTYGITTAGGHAKDHACSLRVQVQKVREGTGSAMGTYESKYHVRKGTIGSTAKDVTFVVDNNNKVFNEDFEALIPTILDSGKATLKGNSYYVGEEKFVGKAKFIEYVKQNPSILDSGGKSVKTSGEAKKLQDYDDNNDDVLGDLTPNTMKDSAVNSRVIAQNRGLASK